MEDVLRDDDLNVANFLRDFTAALAPGLLSLPSLEIPFVVVAVAVAAFKVPFLFFSNAFFAFFSRFFSSLLIFLLFFLRFGRVLSFGFIIIDG